MISVLTGVTGTGRDGLVCSQVGLALGKLLAGHGLLGLEARLLAEVRHLLVEELLRLHVREVLRHLVERLLHHLLHHRMLLLQHELLCLQLLLLVLHQLLVVVVNISALLL